MVFYTSIWACLDIFLMIVLHAFSAALSDVFAKILSYVNIFLHICLVPILLTSGAELSELVLIFTVSLFIRLTLELFLGKSTDEGVAGTPNEDDKDLSAIGNADSREGGI